MLACIDAVSSCLSPHELSSIWVVMSVKVRQGSAIQGTRQPWLGVLPRSAEPLDATTGTILWGDAYTAHGASLLVKRLPVGYFYSSCPEKSPDYNKSKAPRDSHPHKNLLGLVGLRGCYHA